jgi:hypothetical protein
MTFGGLGLARLGPNGWLPRQFGGLEWGAVQAVPWAVFHQESTRPPGHLQGSEEQKQELLPKMAKLESVGCWALTGEPLPPLLPRTRPLVKERVRRLEFPPSFLNPVLNPSILNPESRSRGERGV